MSSGEARFAQLGLAKVERLRDKVLKFLEQNPGDRIGAADAVGLTMSDLRELECRYPDGFVEVDDRYVAKLEKLIARAGLGLPLLDVGENFKIDHAIKALKVMKEKRAKATPASNSREQLEDDVDSMLLGFGANRRKDETDERREHSGDEAKPILPNAAERRDDEAYDTEGPRGVCSATWARGDGASLLSDAGMPSPIGDPVERPGSTSLRNPGSKFGIGSKAGRGKILPGELPAIGPADSLGDED